MSVEIGKAMVDVEARVIRDFAEQGPGIASVACPKCHRQVGIVIGKPYQHICGAVLIAQREEG